MTRTGRAICLAAGALLMAAPAFSQNENQGQGQAVVTILPATATKCLRRLPRTT